MAFHGGAASPPPPPRPRLWPLGPNMSLTAKRSKEEKAFISGRRGLSSQENLPVRGHGLGKEAKQDSQSSPTSFPGERGSGKRTQSREAPGERPLPARPSLRLPASAHHSRAWPQGVTPAAAGPMPAQCLALGVQASERREVRHAHDRQSLLPIRLPYGICEALYVVSNPLTWSRASPTESPGTVSQAPRRRRLSKGGAESPERPHSPCEPEGRPRWAGKEEPLPVPVTLESKVWQPIALFLSVLSHR